MWRAKRLTITAVFGLGSLAIGAEQDYLGWPFDQATFPLCQKYGCKLLGRSSLGHNDGEFVRLQLLGLDAKVTLVLDPDGTIMGLYTLLPGKQLSSSGQAYLQKVMVKSANQDFEPTMLPKCLATLELAPDGREKRQIILEKNHYGVQCLRKREQGVNYWGVWVFFDH